MEPKRNYRCPKRYFGQPQPSKEASNLPSPGSDIRFEDVFDFPCIVDKECVYYLSHHGRVMFILRGQAGTGKHTLSSIILEKYPQSKICCADDYFYQPFAPGDKNATSLKKSHDYCHEETKAACERNSHPIVIQNSNIKKWEMQFYINIAIEYCYTVIMVITTRKVSCAPKVLEKTNTQGLKKSYFKARVKQWEEVIPEYTGWVPSPADIACIMTEAYRCMESLMQVERFSKIYGSTGSDSPKDFFAPKYFPFCLAAYCNQGASQLTREYYLSENVQRVYGKVFGLVIKAFVITRSLMAAVVQLDTDMQKLILDYKEFVPQDAEGLSCVLGAFYLNAKVKAKQPVTDFIQNSEKTVKFCSREITENFDAKNISFLVLSTAICRAPSHSCIQNVSEFSSELFSAVADSDGSITAGSFDVTQNGMKYCRLLHDSWLIIPAKEMYLKSVFTGLYI